VDDAYDAARRRAVAGSIFMGSAAAGGYAAMAAVLGYGGTLVARGSLTPGALTAFLVYTLLIAMSLGALAEIWAEAMRGLGAADRVFALMDREPRMALRGGLVPLSPTLSPGGGEGGTCRRVPSSALNLGDGGGRRDLLRDLLHHLRRGGRRSAELEPRLQLRDVGVEGLAHGGHAPAAAFAARRIRPRISFWTASMSVAPLESAS